MILKSSSVLLGILKDWHFISLGHCYFHVILKIEKEKERVLSLGALSLSFAIFLFREWFPNFNPTSQKLTNAQIWVWFNDLCFEYWHPKIPNDLALGIRVPLRIDHPTLSRDFDHYVCVLIDVDLATKLMQSLILDHEGSFTQISLDYENMPLF